MKKLLLTPLMAFFFFAVAMKSDAQWNLTGNSNATASSVLGTTNAIPLNLTTNNVQRLVIDANGKIGIGTSTPINLLTVKGTGSTPAASWVAAGAPLFVGFGENAVGNADYILALASTSNNARPVFVGRRSRGTLATPTAMVNNDFIMSMLASAHDGTAFQNPATIDFFVDGTPTVGNVPARISFVTGSNSSNRTERLKIGNTGDISINGSQLFVQKSTGNVGIGNILPQAKLDITGQVKITGGTPGAGKVLTSDANGLASWATPSSGTETDPQVSAVTINKVPKWNGTTLIDGSITDNGNVGIGEANPQGILHVSQPAPIAGINFAGTGVNDLITNTSGYNGTGTTVYAIRIQNAGPTPNVIEVSNDGGASWAAPQPIANPITMANGVTASFNNTGGHSFGDQWTWSVSESFYNILVVKDGKIGIGTASPGYLLEVKGQDANINGIDVGCGRGNDTSNTRIGRNSLRSNTTGVSNTAAGNLCMDKNLSGSYNTSSGINSLLKNTIGNSNSAFGTTALVNNTKGYGNTGVGQYTLYYDSITNYNTAIGFSAGDYTYDASYGTFLGNNTRAGNAMTNITAVGNNAVVTASNSVMVGSTSVISIGGQVGWSTLSDGRFKKNVQEDVPGLLFINKLRPVTYNLSIADIDKKLSEIAPTIARSNDGKTNDYSFQPTAAEITAKEEKSKIKYTGFLAQEVEVAAKSLDYNFSGVDAPKNEKDFYGLRYAEFVVPLVKAVQELSKDNEQLKAKVSEMDAVKKEVADLKAMLQQLLNSKSNAPCPPLAGQ